MKKIFDNVRFKLLPLVIHDLGRTNRWIDNRKLSGSDIAGPVIGWRDALAELISAMEASKPISDDLCHRTAPEVHRRLSQEIARCLARESRAETEHWRELVVKHRDMTQGRDNFYVFSKLTQEILK